MKSKALGYLSLPFLFLTGACSSVQTNMNKHISTSETFRAQLAKNYATLSDSHGNRYNIKSTHCFAKKAAMLAKGRMVMPGMNMHHSMKRHPEGLELLAAKNILRKKLALSHKHPKHLADLQFYYDCWVEQASNLNHKDMSCKRKFIEHSSANYAKNCCPETKVHFQFNDWKKICCPEIGLVKQFACKAKECCKNVLVVGNTDCCGTQAYNKKLSVKRAKKVADMLVQEGVAKNKIKILGMGKKHATANDVASRNAGLFFDTKATRECLGVKEKCKDVENRKHHKMSNKKHWVSHEHSNEKNNRKDENLKAANDTKKESSTEAKVETNKKDKVQTEQQKKS
jgi:hypothetical protein